MPSATTDTWNNPQIPPPPPSPAIVGSRYRDTSPSADPDYEARYPEAPNRAENKSPVDLEPSPISRQPSVSKSHHRSDSIPKNPQKKKRTRIPSGGVALGDDPRSQQGYNIAPNYYPPSQYNSLETYNGNGNHSRGYSGPSYYNDSYAGNMNNSYPPPPHMSHIYPPQPRADYDSPYYGNPYTPAPAHLSHPTSSSPLGANGNGDVFPFMNPGFEYSNQTTTGNQAGPNNENHENGANGLQNGASPTTTIRRIEETKEGSENGENGVSDPLANDKTDFGPERTIPKSYPSPRKPPLPSDLNPTITSLAQSPCPSQYRPTGYPLLAKTLSTTPSLQLYRRFSSLNHLLLLHLQDEISELENVLAELDEQEYLVNGGAGLRARRGMGTNSRRLQVMGAIAFKLRQYNKALKGYTDMNIALEPAGEEDVKRYKEWMETSRPLVKAEGMVLIGHPEDLACLQRRTDTDTLDIINSWKQESKKDRRNSNSEIFETPFSPALKLGMTVLSCGMAGLAKWRASQVTGTGLEVSLALAAGATGGAAAMMWAFL